MRDKYCKSNSKLRVSLEDIILRQVLYVATNAEYTYLKLTICENFGKSTTDLNLRKGNKNITIKTLSAEETNIKTRHKAMVIHIGENDIKSVLTKTRNDLKPPENTNKLSKTI